MLKRTTAINKILKLKKRVKIIQGGTSAGKTFGILPILIDKATKTPSLEISIVAESIPHLRRGALKDFLNIMKWTNRFFDSRYNKSLLRYEFANGSYIEFFSADDSSKLRGARRDVLYINECNNVAFNSYNELSIRTKSDIYLDFNPANEFWVHTELKDEVDSDFLILTYRDNEALDPRIVREIEKNKAKSKTSAYWENWWRVYGEGLVGMLGPILDTILVCTITGLIIIISGAYLESDLNGIVLSLEAFRRLFFGFGDYILIIMISIFGISTLFTYSYYGVKCFGFLTTPKKGKYYNIIYIAAIIISSILTVEIVIGLIDVAFALMAIPNMIAIIYLSGIVTKEMKSRSWI